MKPLSLQWINASAPYEVQWHEASRTYRFASDFGVELAIAFDEDDIIEAAESYTLSIINVNNLPSPSDAKVRDTIMLIIENFFDMNQAALLYICESGDGRQKMRGRLFELWFATYKLKERIMLMPASIEDAEGVDNFAALLLRKDNPDFVNIVADFSDTVAMLKLKPEH